MKKYFINDLTYLTSFFLFLTETFVDEVILAGTNKIIKGPDIEFKEFLRFIDIWALIK